MIRADVIAQAEFITEAQENAGAQSGVGFLEQFQGEAVFAEQIRAAVANEQHRLLLGDVLDFAGIGFQHLRAGPREFQLHRFHPPELCLDLPSHLVCIHVAKNGDHQVVWHDKTAMEISQIGAGEFRQRLGFPEDIQAIRMLRVQCFAQGLLALAQNLVLLALELRDLHRALALQHRVGECRVLQHVGQQIQRAVKVLAQRLGGHAEAVVAGKVADLAANGFHRLGNLLGGARFRAL